MYKNLEYLLRTKKISGGWISKQIGISDSAFSQFRNGKSPLSKQKLIKLAKLLNSSVEEILDREELVVTNTISVKHFKCILNNIYKTEQQFMDFINNNDNYINSSLDKEDLKSLNIYKLFEDLISFVYNQDSMSPTIKDKDLIYIDISDRNLSDGVYLINEDGLLRVRRLKKDPTKPTICIKSDNTSDIDYKEYNLLPGRLREIVYGKIVFCKRSIF